ncbi:GATA zinc finger domain-containing protein 14 [Amyelois transitella]|uniref:GATA zinc finger domain-containing protein 14 n=1 Tax=Amyelois transitella TaxID=680683 RepID=UPI00067BC417|nr:GATA zinc finger domain-containing protein 14 [Amyelois transitella]
MHRIKSNAMFIVYLWILFHWQQASGKNNGTEIEKQNSESTPVSVNSRFFDLGQLFNPLFSNFNQNRPAGNVGTNFPENSQFSPVQGSFPQRPNLGNQWANENQGNLRPPVDQEFNSQQPYEANQWQPPQFSGQGSVSRPDYPGGYNSNQMQQPNQYVGSNQNPSNWRPQNNFQGSNQYPNQFDSNGLYTHVQLPTNQGQDRNQPRPIPNPEQNNPNMFPGPEYQRPPSIIVNNYTSNQYPGNMPQGQDFGANNNFYPNQGSWQNPNNSGGTLDDMISTQVNNGSGNNAILGKPVIIPTTTINPDQIVFDDSSESPLQRQCVQDCPATPEYNPICGTNNVTYFNPGKFVCARNCGVSVYVARRGVCRRRPM